MPADAATAPSWLGRRLNLHFGERRPPASHPERYQIDTGGGFILDREPHAVFLRFDDSPEVWVLNAARGPRGDVIFSNDLGQVFLRTTKLGGVTVFTDRYPEGSAASTRGAAVPLRLGRIDPGQLFQRLLADSTRASRAAGEPISFQALDADPGSSGLIADAALLASLAIADIAASPRGRALLPRLGRVDIAQGRRAAAELTGGALRVTVVTHLGLLGRPSSAAIRRCLVGDGPFLHASRPDRRAPDTVSNRGGLSP